MRAAALLVLALAVIAAGCSGDGGGTTNSAEPSATLEVRQVQTELGYSEGSVGVLRVLTPEGRPTGPVQVSGEPSRIGRSYESAFPPLALPPGEYEVELWQHPCSGPCPSEERIAEANDPPADQPDPCTAHVTLTAGETRKLTATWAPGNGCTSFS